MEEIFRKIKAFAFDVDGVLTDGGVFANLDGELFRTFDAKDGFALRMAYLKGYPVAIITGGRSECIRQRVISCGVKYEDVYLGSRDKIEDFDDFCAKYQFEPEQVLYMGDDLPDIPVMQKCGCGVSPADGVEEVKQAADYISPCPGGRCCVRQVIEAVLKAQGCWTLDTALYKEKF